MKLSRDRHPFPAVPRAVRRAAAAVAACAAVALPAQAVVSTSSPSLWVAADDSFDAVARFGTSAGVNCSGSLLAGGAYVLTAAHCVTTLGTSRVNASSVALSFDGGRVTASVSSAAQISVYASWTGALGQNNDLALLRLDRAVTSLSGYQVAGTSALGSTVVLAGYGYSGVGSTGYSSAGGLSTLHWGRNQYDEVYTSATSAGGSVLFDFDDGTARHNVMGGLGLGAAEAMIAPGDSGGPSFVETASGSLLLVGVHSFGSQADGSRYDIDGPFNSTYGELGGDTSLASASTLTWLASVAQVSAVPEPASAALLVAGGALLLLARRRRAA